MLLTGEAHLSPPTVALGRETLYQIIGALARGPDLGRVLPAIVEQLVQATACHACFIYLREGDVLRLRAASDGYAGDMGEVVIGLDEGSCGAAEHFQSRLAVPLLGRDGDDVVGVVVLDAGAPREFDQDVRDFVVHVASLVAGVIDRARLYEETRQQADVIERLTRGTFVRELFDALADGRADAAESRARSAGYDADDAHVVAVLEPLAEPDACWPEAAARAEAFLRRLVPGCLCDRGDERLRALLPLGGGDAALELIRLDHGLDRLAREEGLAAGRSEPRRGVAGDGRGLAEAACAAKVARAVAPEGASRGYGDLGVYRYLAQLPSGHAPDERHARAIAVLATYDARRRTELLSTLERHLGDRGALAATARALYIHTNTLRQRLDRIEQLTGLVLADEDLLSLELALKLARLHGTACVPAPA